MNSFNVTFPQTVFGLLVTDLVSGRGLNYVTVGSTNEGVTSQILLDPVVPSRSRTIIQLSYTQVGLAALTSDLQGLWALQLKFPVANNIRLYVKLPPAMDRTSVQLSPQQQQTLVYEYLDSDNRWVIVLAAGTMPSNTLLTIQYRLSTKLWGEPHCSWHHVLSWVICAFCHSSFRC